MVKTYFLLLCFMQLPEKFKLHNVACRYISIGQCCLREYLSFPVTSASFLYFPGE